MTGPEPQPSPHTAIRPLWICRTDAQPWPCAEARLALTQEYRDALVDLCVYLGLSLARATRELYQLNPSECPSPEAMHGRFIGWVPVPRSRLASYPDNPRGAVRRRSL